MNIKDLNCFEVVYEEQSINKAAKKLFITPQGLSKNIRTLESELNTVLFERTKSGVTPTDSAAFLYEKAGFITKQFEVIENGISQLNNQKERLRIGCAYGVLNVLPLQMIMNFIKKNPSIQVNWCEHSTRSVKEMIEDSKLEYGFIVGECESPHLIQEKLASRKIYLLVYEGHPFYHEKSISVNEMQSESLIVMNEQFHMYHDFQNACKIRGFTPNIVAKTADATFLYTLCKQGMGLALVPDFVLEDYNLEGMKAIPLEEDLRWDVYGIYKKDNMSYEAIRNFKEYLNRMM